MFALEYEHAEWDRFKHIFGNCVILDHGDCYTIYAHMDATPLVHEGYHVPRGTLLGYVGETGYAFGPHLHWGMAQHDNRYFIWPPSGPVGVLLDPLDFVQR